jgi:hypothetical protein
VRITIASNARSVRRIDHRSRTAEPSPEADHEFSVLLQEWLLREGPTYPAMPMDGAYA